MKHANLRRRVLIPLSLTFMLLLCIFLYSTYSIRRDNISSSLDIHYHEAQSLFSELLSIKSDWLIAKADAVLIDPDLKSAMRAKNRDLLYRLSQAHFKKLTANDGITHLYFHEADGNNFLRTHNPALYGDSITRDTLRRAMQTGNPAQGLELGTVGSLSLRLVIPWYDNSTLLGFIELASDVERTMQSLGKVAHVDYLMALDKSLLNQKAWESAMAMAGRITDWDAMPDRVVSASSLRELPGNLFSMLSQNAREQPVSEDWISIRADNRNFAARRFPLVETGGRIVGDFVLLYDVTQQETEFRKFILHVLLFGVIVCSVLFGFAWSLLGKTQVRLDAYQRQLSDEIDKINSINWQMESEISERKKAEQQLQQMNDSLEQRVAERTYKLELMRRELEEQNSELQRTHTELKSQQAMILHQDKMASIGLLAAGVAHDINNPIGFVSNNLEELRVYMANLRRYVDALETVAGNNTDSGQIDSLKGERQRLDVEFIFEDFDSLIAESLDGAERVGGIVRNLRNFSRVDGAEYKLVDINDCLESTINITSHELRYKAVVHKNFGDISPVRCCPQQLNQVFMNLLINAGHAIEKRGEVTVTTWQKDDEVFVSIGDTGSGIPQEIVPHIFEPFFTTKETGKGTGLGLSIAADIIRQHHGEITVQSRAGEGTVFTIRLPLDAGDGVSCDCLKDRARALYADRNNGET